MNYLKLLLCYFYYMLLIVNYIHGEEYPVVAVDEGVLKGKYMFTRNGRQISAFLGIPYAEKPTGDRRFALPHPPSSWEGEWDATQDGNACIQLATYLVEDAFVSGEEDCLYLNVYTPNVSTKQLFPVMVFIHGGGFTWGSGSSTVYGPEFLLDKDIILVTLNYRLGPLGFLCMEDEVLPGNLGLKDQNAALRWVNKNIIYFGGNSKSVTIFGESAGAASVHFHMKSALSKGLFHRGISQSGSSLCSWAGNPRGFYKKQGAILANLLGCPSTPTTSMVDCLRKIPAYNITQALANLRIWDTDPPIVFPPAIEPPHVIDAFLTADPWTIPTTLPWLTGTLSEEGALKVSSIIKDNNLEKLENLNNEFEKYGSLSLLFENTAENPEKLALAVRKFYFGDKEISKNTLKELLDMYSDSWFLYCSKEAIRRHFGIVYHYYFTYKGANTLSFGFGNTNEDLGVCHVDDLLYLFMLKDFVPIQNVSVADTEFSRSLIDLWTNFATFGNPTPPGSQFTWKPVDGDNFFLNISNDGFKIEHNLLTERDNFWASLNYREKTYLTTKDKKLCKEL